jgi:hypothetical protein
MGFSPAFKKSPVPTKWERLQKTEAELAVAQIRLDKMAEERRIAEAEAEREGRKGKVQLLTSGAQKAYVNHKRKQIDPIVDL